MKITLETREIEAACIAYVQKMFPDKPVRARYFYSSPVDVEVGPFDDVVPTPLNAPEPIEAIAEEIPL